MRVSSIVPVAIAWLAILYAQAAPDSTPAAQKWRQGIEARKNRLLRLRAKLKEFAEESSSDASAPTPLKCSVALETALIVALTDGHVIDEKTEEFHVFIRARREKEYLDVGYIYNRRGALVGTAVARLPAEWVVGLQPGEANANKLIVTTDKEFGCIFEFNSADPFASKAVASQPE